MKKKLPKIVLFFVIMLLSMIYSVKWLDKINMDLDKDTVDLLLESSGLNNKKNRIVNKIITIIKDANIVDPVTILIDNFKVEKVKGDNVVEVSKTETPTIEDGKTIVYIYNSHQTEAYNSSKEINLNYTVLDASYYLQKKLKTYGINSYVENASFPDVLNANNWKYASSYRVSRMFLEKRTEENKDLKYFVDLHRDSVSKKISTVEINGKSYAKILFLLGLENEDYKKNEVTINKMNDWVNKNYQGLSRGIYRKSGKGVNGVYNQDFSSNCILIEIGGEENTYEEVENTIDVIAEMLNTYIGEENEKENS